ncbi:hypothetical protein NM208_g10853 [Fusarium decemcellulare]|uniref:Uncharacterized protein n=1 Tax=Fusarium decemcellulare TaxID=57161 RepID=A0ACC1RWE6_9HYPO|nr:hypothetical protein NM208_g10853 [Fusarium decemcellulare]
MPPSGHGTGGYICKWKKTSRYGGAWLQSIDTSITCFNKRTLNPIHNGNAAVSAHGRDVRHGKSGSGSSLNYGPVPGSPTLTNPDMILPDYDCDADSLDDRSQSPIMLWNNSRANDMRFHLPPSQNPFVAGPITPSTPIIYGNGTMLSDIGEVTEVESVVGATGSRRISHLSVHNDEDLMQSSPTMGVSRIKSRSQIMSRERRSSLESNSTITSQGQNAPFADFDDAVSVDDINFQGDDEESMASSYVEGTPAQEPRPVRVPRTKEVEEQRYSTSSLSDRAEQILANAKQRLTTMEGNLSRARSSLFYHPMSDGSTPSPPIVRPATSLRESTLPPGTGHSRMLSETTLQEDYANSGYQRSASALGAAGGYRQPLTSSKSADALIVGYGNTYRTPLYALDTTLEALSEDEDGMNGDSRRSSAQNLNLQSPTFGSFMDKDITRSASCGPGARSEGSDEGSPALGRPAPLLMRDGTKDSSSPGGVKALHRRRYPGRVPGTQNNVDDKDTPDQEAQEAARLEEEEAANVAYEEAPESSSDKTIEGVDLPAPEPELVTQEEPQPQPKIEVDEEGEDWEGDLGQEEEDRREVIQDAVRDDIDDDIQNDVQDDAQEYVQDYVQDDIQDDVQDGVQVADQQEEQEDEEDEFVDYESESGDSMYHDTFQHPVSHEDREDAFDYEHFFLHSAMGTISQQRLGRRGSWGSVTSEDSVETTRGPMTDRKRRSSIDTVSSLDTFATATEGRVSRSSTTADETADDTTETILETPDDSDGPPTSKRTTFGGFQFPERPNASSRNGSVDLQQSHPRRNTIIHRPTNSVLENKGHRPSVSSFESTGTNRSFPLVNKSKSTPEVSTPEILTPAGSTPDGSPDSELRQIRETLMNEAAGLGVMENGSSSGRSSAVQGLSKEDGILVERLVASLGKCVLGLSEVSKSSSEARMYRRRIDIAKRVLEGLEDL